MPTAYVLGTPHATTFGAPKSDNTTNEQPEDGVAAEAEQPPLDEFEFAVILKDEETGAWGEQFVDIGDTTHDAFIVAGALGGEVVARQVGPWDSPSGPKPFASGAETELCSHTLGSGP